MASTTESVLTPSASPQSRESTGDEVPALHEGPRPTHSHAPREVLDTSPPAASTGHPGGRPEAHIAPHHLRSLIASGVTRQHQSDGVVLDTLLHRNFTDERAHGLESRTIADRRDVRASVPVVRNRIERMSSRFGKRTGA